MLLSIVRFPLSANMMSPSFCLSNDLSGSRIPSPKQSTICFHADVNGLTTKNKNILWLVSGTMTDLSQEGHSAHTHSSASLQPKNISSFYTLIPETEVLCQ